ncbi:MAG: delta-60 repeat domain-containing protein [Spirochaetia bacterium]
MLIGGDFTSYNFTRRGHVARLNSDGSLDIGFAKGAGADGDMLSIAVQSHGRILIGGSFSTYNGLSRTCIARLWN